MSEITDCLEEGLVGGDNHILAKVTTHGNGERVAEDHSESSLVDGMLTPWFGDLFFAWEPGEGVLELGVWDKARSDLVNMLSLESLFS